MGVVIRFNWPSLRNIHAHTHTLHTSHSHGFHKVSLVGASWLADLKTVFTSCMGWGRLDQHKTPFPALRLHALLLSPVTPQTISKLIASDINMQLPYWYVVLGVKIMPQHHLKLHLNLTRGGLTGGTGKGKYLKCFLECVQEHRTLAHNCSSVIIMLSVIRKN